MVCGSQLSGMVLWQQVASTNSTLPCSGSQRLPWGQGEESCLRRFRFRFLDTSVSSALANGGGRVEVQVCRASEASQVVLVSWHLGIQHTCVCTAQAEAGANGCAHPATHSQAGSVGGAPPAFILAGEVRIPAFCIIAFQGVETIPGQHAHALGCTEPKLPS